MSFVSNILGGVGRAVGSVLSSPIGQAAALGAGLYFGAPYLSSLVAPEAAAAPLSVAAADTGMMAAEAGMPAVAGAAGGGAGFLSGLTNLIPSGMNLGSAMSIGSGLYGLSQASQLQRTAQQAAQMQDPFGPYRSQYANQLSYLMANPTSVSSLPGYQAGLDAVMRSQAAGGYLGSGNMMAALQQYGGNFYQQQLQNLMGLSGAGFAPSGGNVLMQGTGQAANLAGASLGSIGYGAMLPQLSAMLRPSGLPAG